MTSAVLFAQFHLAGTLAAVGHIARAKALASDGLNTSEQCGDTWARSQLLQTLARCARLDGDLDQAHRLLLAALEFQRGFRDSFTVALMVEQLSQVCADQSDFTRAARLLGTANAIWSNLGADIAGYRQPNAAHVHRLVRTLREPVFRAAFAEGAQTTVPQAIEYALQRPTPAETGSRQDHQVLTRREREVAELVGAGLSNRQIAERLVLSPRTVDGHVEHTLAKLGYTSRSQVAAWIAAQHANDQRAT